MAHMPHSDQCRTRIAQTLQSTDKSKKRLPAFETRTNQQIAIEIQRSATDLKMDAPDAQGEIVPDGQAAASSAEPPPQFGDLPAHAEPSTVTAAGNHHRLPRVEETFSGAPGAMTPEGEIYSPTSPEDHRIPVHSMMIP